MLKTYSRDAEAFRRPRRRRAAVREQRDVARRYHTMVGTKAVCASMCGIIWRAGSTRWVFATSHIGFHSPYFSDKRISPVGAAVIGAFLAKLGLSDVAIRYLTEAVPNTMNWLTAEKARELGIDSRVATQPACCRVPFRPMVKNER
jgi:hypothetical protein